MLTGMDQSELLVENLSAANLHPSESVLHELTHLAMTQDELPFLAAGMFEMLRKVTGQPAALEYLGGIQDLAMRGNPAGARLLAAFLNVSTPGDRLLPVIRPLDSCRRFHAQLAANTGGMGPFQADWCDRLMRIEIVAKKLSGDLDPTPVAPQGLDPRQQHPWLLLRETFGHLLNQARDENFWNGDEGPTMLAELLRLEVDAWQERISQLAGNINPFQVQAVARVLPILNRADAEIRDLRLMSTWVTERDHESAFIRPQARWRETLDDKDWGHLLQDLQKHEGLAGMARLAQGLATQPILLPQLAEGTRRIMDLSAALVEIGARDSQLELFTACLLAQSHFRNGQIVFAVDKELAAAVTTILPESGAAGHPLQRVSVMSGLVIIELNEELPPQEHGLPHARGFTAQEEEDLFNWRRDHNLLTVSEREALATEDQTAAGLPEETADEDENENVDEMDTAALKNLVMTNIQSVSVLLGFLRNPKMIAIPGLVEDVVNRTRNPQIIATIASERALHTGFANKGVALACLRSPVNVSVKTLRKFCHVKYVSKVELKRMAQDRTGIRKEVAREIAKYLAALA